MAFLSVIILQYQLYWRAITICLIAGIRVDFERIRVQCTWSLFTAFTRHHHHSLSWVWRINTKSFHSLSIRTVILFLPCRCSPSGLFPADFLTKPRYVFLFPAALPQTPICLIFRYRVTRKQCDEDRKSSSVPTLALDGSEDKYDSRAIPVGFFFLIRRSSF